MNPEATLIDTAQRLGIALGLGFLVGLQRERTHSRIGGIRTFPLMTVLGAVAGLLALRFGGWILAAGLLSVAALLYIGNQAHLQNEPDPGLTTEVAMLLMFGIGAYLVAGYKLLGVALGGMVAVLLQAKPELHALAGRLGEKDFKAMMQFVLVSLVILPVLPNQAYGPYQVLNPFKIWLLVVLIVGMRLGGYVAYKWMGARAGSVLGGVVGGLISSTATTVNYARQAREAPATGSMAALVIMVASTVVFLRVLIIVGVVAPMLFGALSGPLGAMLGAAAVITGGFRLLAGRETVAVPEHENPSELKPALIFASVFAVVQLGVAAAKQYFGSQGLYALAFVSGLPDVDAITLSTLDMARGSQLDAEMAWRMIILASMANILFKAGTIAVVGNRKLLARIAVPFSLTLVAGGLILWMWP
jgi:uncharacterized membrane protein (DUF4010 family)